MDYKRVKDLKVGDKVWLYTPYASKEGGYEVLSIKKQKTLAIVTIKAKFFGDEREFVCYGHVSGELLTFNGANWQYDVPFICDYRRIKEERDRKELWEKERNIGVTVLKLKELLDL